MAGLGTGTDLHSFLGGNRNPPTPIGEVLLHARDRRAGPHGPQLRAGTVGDERVRRLLLAEYAEKLQGRAYHLKST